MYIINKNISKRGDIELNNKINSFLMGSKNKVYKIKGNPVKNIQISSKKLATPLVTTKVLKKYKELITYITELFFDDDDDTGDSYREALNQIEKFRLEIKNKYRDFLLKKELEMMSKQLVLLQKEANKRLLELHDSYVEMLSTRRSR